MAGIRTHDGHKAVLARNQIAASLQPRKCEWYELDAREALEREDFGRGMSHVDTAMKLSVCR